MLEAAAILLFLVGLMHSVLGEKNLIRPLLAREDFPVILGSVRNAKLTLWFGWHALTLFWWAQAIVLIVMARHPGAAVETTLLTWALACGIMGMLALVVSKGRHLSWIFFLPLAGLMLAAFWG